MFSVIRNPGWHKNQEGEDSVILEEPKLSYLGYFFCYCCYVCMFVTAKVEYRQEQVITSLKVSILVK